VFAAATFNKPMTSKLISLNLPKQVSKAALLEHEATNK
jgi:hypothetical protein